MAFRIKTIIAWTTNNDIKKKNSHKNDFQKNATKLSDIMKTNILNNDTTE